MNAGSLSLAVTSALTLAACAMAWTRANTTPEQLHQDYAECEITAYGKHPENVVHVQSESLREPSKDVDTNETLRNEETNYCMRRRGYVYQRAN